MNVILRINPQFERICPPLSAEEFAQLEANILKLGKITDPIQIWNSIILDGHQRYKIAQKHPEVSFTTCEIEFEDEYEAICWICNLQLGRRNINEINREYLIGKRYASAKMCQGGDRKSEMQKSRGQNGPLILNHPSRKKIAKENNISESKVKRSEVLARGVDAAEEVHPGFTQKVFSGEIKPQRNELYEIAKMPKEERKEAVERLLAPKPKPQKDDQDDKSDKSADPKKPKKEIEQSILDSMTGSANMFIDSINNYLSRFPRLRTEPKYSTQTKEILEAVKNYINDVEGDLK